MTPKAYTTRLTEKESRALHDVERMIAEWTRAKPSSNREQPMWDEILLAKDEA